jgi:23S rRNA A2030 N6-methylase RlmJ
MIWVEGLMLVVLWRRPRSDVSLATIVPYRIACTGGDCPGGEPDTVTAATRWVRDCSSRSGAPWASSGWVVTCPRSRGSADLRDRSRYGAFCRVLRRRVAGLRLESAGQTNGDMMANRHFGKLADVWKHLPLAEILAAERPEHYCETHAGSASYPMVDDPERRFGVQRFVDVAETHLALSNSRYLRWLRDFEDSDRSLHTYPGSALIAMLERGNHTSYLFCDLDPESVASLESAAQRVGVTNARCVAADGMAAVHDHVRQLSGKALVHIDPFDPAATGPSGLSALDLAAQLTADGIGLMYWYGYDNPNERAWALDALSQQTTDATDIWCGDIMITTSGEELVDGHLGKATTPGTGFGIVCANLASTTIDACERLGRDVARAYDQVTLPSGDPGGVDFTTAWR